MQDYINQTYGISFQLPDNWELFENQEMGGFQILPPSEGEQQHLHTGNLSILIRPQGDIAAEDAGVLNYIASEIVRSNYANYDNYVLHSLRHGAFGQKSSREIIFSYNDVKNDVHMQALQVITVARGSLFLFTYTASVKHFSNNLHAVAEIMASVEFGEFA